MATTPSHVVDVEIDRAIDEDLIDQIIDDLAAHHVGVSSVGADPHILITLTLDEPNLLRAVTQAVTLTGRYGDVVGVSALPEQLRDEREGFTTDPHAQVIGAPDAARLLGISGAAVRKLAAKGTIAGTHLNDRAWSLDLASVLDYKERRGA